MKYTECNKLVRKQAFEKAISSDVPEKTLADIHSDLESIGEYLVIFWRLLYIYVAYETEIEADYDGPKLAEDGKVTIGFLEDLMECYKKQKKLHRKFAYKVICTIHSYSMQSSQGS